MAVDSREKRASAITFGGLIIAVASIIPDGVIDEPVRAFSVQTYTGIDIDEGDQISYPPTVSDAEVAFASGFTGDFIDGITGGFMGGAK